ncbi:MAG: hemerythrin domain-containing protein [Woeseiaceae bacterium]|nr:hemerythrin domain-containing protein [Woeseiaceae bacterium]
MPESITTLMGHLREDHRNMAKLLDLLDRESEKLHAEMDADLELMHDILRYMTIYPDVVHHPNEDKVFAELRAARPDLATGMHRVMKDHREIEQLGRQLRDLVARADSGEPVRRVELVAAASRYIDVLRAHMNWEESDLFRRVDRMVADGHDQIERAQLVNMRDPVFSRECDAQFLGLVESLSKL